MYIERALMSKFRNIALTLPSKYDPTSDIKISMFEKKLRSCEADKACPTTRCVEKCKNVFRGFFPFFLSLVNITDTGYQCIHVGCPCV